MSRSLPPLCSKHRQKTHPGGYKLCIALSSEVLTRASLTQDVYAGRYLRALSLDAHSYYPFLSKNSCLCLRLHSRGSPRAEYEEAHGGKAVGRPSLGEKLICGFWDTRCAPLTQFSEEAASLPPSWAWPPKATQTLGSSARAY